MNDEQGPSSPGDPSDEHTPTTNTSSERSITSQGNISGVASTGDNSINIQTIVDNATIIAADAIRPPAEVAAPTSLINVPLRPRAFVGRKNELAALDAILASSNDGRAHVLHGLGGIGKSTLVAHYATANPTRYSMVWWINADEQTNIDIGLANLAVALQPVASALTSGALREWSLQWLAAHDNWLIILDGVNSPDDVSFLLARAGHGAFIITSNRATGWHNLATQMQLDAINPPESIRLMTHILGDRDVGQIDEINDLCIKLGHLPLAIEQAGSYIAETGISVHEYHDYLTNFPATMYQTAAGGVDSERTIARIWHLTLEKLSDDPLCATILRILAWYSNDHIPTSLLEGLAEPPVISSAIGRLAAYSMLTSDRGDLSVHRLVQAVSRTPDPNDEHRQPDAIATGKDQAISQLARAIPDDWLEPSSWPTWRRLVPHVNTLASHIEPETDNEIMTYILNEAGLFLEEQGEVELAIKYVERALQGGLRIYGDKHPEILSIRNNLANMLHGVGDISRSVDLLERNLADRLDLHGNDHPLVATSRNNLAMAYQTTGNLQQAISLLEENLEYRLRTLGNDHPDTFLTRDNLAGAYQNIGDVNKAMLLYEQNLEARIAAQGNDHRDVLMARNNLAYSYDATGDLVRATKLFEQGLDDSVRIMGDDHPYTLRARGNLAHVYLSTGNSQNAILLYKQTLNDSVRILGNNHLDTLKAISELAAAYAETGYLEVAIPLLKHALARMVNLTGPDNPVVLLTRNNLAGAYHSAGDLENSVSIVEQNVADTTRLLGENHPDTLQSRMNLAGMHLDMGNFELAIPMCELVVEDSARILGGDHPMTLIARGNLASAFSEIGEKEMAVQMYEQVVAASERALGNDHNDTRRLRHNLGVAYLNIDEPSKALPLFAQALKDNIRIYGPTHPKTMEALNDFIAARMD